MKKVSALLWGLLVAAMCVSLCACGPIGNSGEPQGTTESTQESSKPTETDPPATEEATSAATEATTAPAPSEATTVPAETEQAIVPVDIETVGGVVIVGEIGFENGQWYIVPEQPLNITYEYFLEKPSVFPEQTSVRLIDPKDDGMDKSVYLGHTVTVCGTFRFVRDDFETLYLLPYTITMGKLVEESYGDSEIQAPDAFVDLYDRSKPLPQPMDPTITDGKYSYNAFMLSEESLQLMGNDFAVFYCDFVDAFLNYRTTVPCPNRDYAEMLGSVIYYDFPLFDACAEAFEFFKHYDSETNTVSIVYKYSESEHRQRVAQFLEAADQLLATVTSDMSDVEKAKNIYHELCTRMVYDDSALVEIDRKDSYFAYLHNSGVCITFANVYNQLLTQVGIRTTVATCEYDATMGHAWSIVTLNGVDYFCDPTFELSRDNGSGYLYFGMNYAKRTENGLGVDGIRGGRYFTYPVLPEMIGELSLEQ